VAIGLIQPATWRSTTLIVSDSAVILSATAAAVYLQLGGPRELPQALNVLASAALVTCIFQFCLYYVELYDRPLAGGDKNELIIRTLQSLGVTFLILAAVYTAFPSLVIPRGVAGPAAAFATAMVVCWRLAFVWLSHRVGPRERLLLVGRSMAGLALAREVDERRELGVHIVGFVDVDAENAFTSGALPLLGGLEDIPAITRARAVDRVVVSLADSRGKLPMDKLLAMRLSGVRFDHLASVYEEYTGKIAVENLRPSWLIFSPGFRKTRRLLAAKRGMDACCGAIGLLLSAPVIVVLAGLIKLTSPGPVFYSQQRVGRDGRLFTIYKLRSMRADAESKSGPVWVAHSGDARITPLGLFMRRTRLDELPQFWNILAGSMSMVGPRPERPEFVHGLAEQIPFYGQRHVVKPGLTGWAQVRYTYGASVEDAMEKLQYDLYYIKHLSITFDLFIILDTVKTVLWGRGR
jgi:sugar transferase (PEP-CTERM system associated)